MTKTEEIAQKKAQIDQLRKEVRALRNEGELTVGRAKINRRNVYCYGTGELWLLSYNVHGQPIGQRPVGTKFKSFYAGTREECIEAIPGIIADLQALYKEAKEANG